MSKKVKTLPIFFSDENVVLPGAYSCLKIRSGHGNAWVKAVLLPFWPGRHTVLLGIVPSAKDTSARNILKGSVAVDQTKVNSATAAIGTVAVLEQVSGSDWNYSLHVIGVVRFKVIGLLQDKQPLPFATVQVLETTIANNGEFQDAVVKLRRQVHEYLWMLARTSELSVAPRLKEISLVIPDYQLADYAASIVPASTVEKLEVLRALDMEERIKVSTGLLEQEMERLEAEAAASSSLVDSGPTPLPVNSNQMIDKLIRRLGTSRTGFVAGGGENNSSRRRHQQQYHDEDEPSEVDGEEDDHKVLKRRLDASIIVFKELKRLKQMNVQSPEHPVLKNYLELVAELPWANSSVEAVDLAKVKQDLDSDHHAMTEVKERIVQLLSVKQLNPSLRGPILCLYGPPGVGKTSIGQSIARSLGRKFHRIALGGVSDQAEIRGHRRTYLGSMAGRFIQAFKVVGVNNPVLLLDEVDKMSPGIHGDPMAALLEVLDPEQNANFVDHYLGLPFDLSKVLFIATANDLKSIPAALRDRMEMIGIPGYTIEDKIPIAQLHLIPKQMKRHGLTKDHCLLPEDSIHPLIEGYTRESGVRQLEQRIAALCRAVAVIVARDLNPAAVRRGQDSSSTTVDEALPIVMSQDWIGNILGPPAYEDTICDRVGQVGVAIGLACTAVGGEVLVVEATKMAGNGDLVLTGQLGSVMKESASIALSWIRSHSDQLGIALNPMQGVDVHIHFPAGAIGKDGPSAGLTITMALISLFTERICAQDVAMTGEITLRGVILAVGGIKEKVIAAKRWGVRKVILPQRNKKDLQDVPAKVQNGLEFRFVRNVEQVMEELFFIPQRIPTETMNAL